MCLHPVTIPNPAYNKTCYAVQGDDIVVKPSQLSSAKEFIQVPCSKCPECRGTYFNSILQRAIVESLTSYVYFVTLTYDDKHIPSIELPDGDIIYYSDYSHIQDMFKRLRHNHVLDRAFRYLVATEYGDKRHRPHFHLLIFVERYSDDDLRTVPFIYERILFYNLSKYYALNVGTRKQPIYEPLFTYTFKYTPQGLKTNYFVKYVQPIKTYDRVLTDSEDMIKTIRYLIGYVNKSSKFDTHVHAKLDKLHDNLIKSKYKNKLLSRVRYSKGFGLGFKCGKHYTQRYFTNCSYATALYSKMEDIDISILDDKDTFDAFNRLIMKCSMYSYDSISDLRSKLDGREFELFIILCKLFPNYISYLHQLSSHHKQIDTISFHYRTLHPRKYEIHNEVVGDMEVSSVMSYIRKGVEYGIAHKLPFLAFPLYSSQVYMPLCKFYCERYTTHEDTLRMYKSVGVTNYDEWLQLFTKYINTNKASIAKANELTHEVEVMQHVRNPPKSLTYEELLITC